MLFLKGAFPAEFPQRWLSGDGRDSAAADYINMPMHNMSCNKGVIAPDAQVPMLL